MFKTAATKIAHNSTLPALGGNQDLRPLQDLITAEKAVLIALQKLSVDYSKASEALRTWGLNEGDDLGDILSASTTILNHFSSALSQYASHGHTMRDQLKAIRTREEALHDLKTRRRTVMRKADDADKKLSKMSPEHKNLAMQTETLNRLRDDIRTMDSEIMTEEAALADFKRTSTRMWMGLKFGGLLEMCEKGTIVAEFGKMIIGEISEEITQPGLPRSLYYGHSKTENYVAEAHRCINEVVLSTVPSVGFRDRRQYEQRPQEIMTTYQPANDGFSMNSGQWTPTDANKPQPPPPIRSSNDYPTQQAYPGGEPASPTTATYSSFSNQSTQGSGFQASAPYPDQQVVDDFGVNARSPGLVDNSSTSGGRFATFPVKRPLGSNPYGLSDAGPRHDQEQSLSASIAAALDEGSQETVQPTDGASTQPSWLIGSRSNTGPSPASPTTYTQQAWGGRDQSYGSPPGPTSPQTALRQLYTGSAPLPPPPPGAAPPDLSDPWANANRNGSLQPTNGNHTRNISEISGNDALLAYMTTPRSEPPSPQTLTHPMGASLSAPQYEDEQQRISRHVRFGEIQDVEQEMLARKSLDQTNQVNANEGVQISIPETVQADKAPETHNESPKPLSPASSSSDNDASKPKSRRVPPPTFQPEQDEKALDAAAAREVTRELEALKIGTPASPVAASQTQPEPPVERGQASPQPQQADNTSLPTPTAQFANHSVSPHPYADLNTNANPPTPTPYPGGYTAAQSYAQSYQNPGPYGSAPSSPAQAYAQSYQASSQASDPHPTSTIPPRFQALNQEIQVPPRFQGSRSHSPASPSTAQVPPRFQTGSGGASQIPPTIALPEGKGVDAPTPYRTPPEYPRGLGAASPYARSASSLSVGGGGASGIPTTTRTISASAFRKPRNTSVDNLGGGLGDPFKKTLPSSPYPSARDPGAGAGAGAGAPAASGISSLPPGAGPPGNAAARKSVLDDDEYDYISAYVNSNPNSPLQGEFDQGAQGAGAAGVGAGGGRAGGGYNDGRFATDLDGSLR